MSERRGGPEIHDAKADPAWTRGRLVRVGDMDDKPTRFAGVVGDRMPTRKDGKHGKPTQVTFDRSTAASGRWLGWVAEGLVLPMKLGNASGGKEP